MVSRAAIDPKTGRRRDFVDPHLAKLEAERERREASRALNALLRQDKAVKARTDLLVYTQFTMPDPTHADDINATRYETAKFHKAVAKALEDVESGKVTQLIFCMPPRHGKSCAHDTPVLTPAGWRQHGDLQPGDYVFGPDGLPTEVIALSADVDEAVPVTFSNGEVIRCHLNHEWTVYDRAAAKWKTLETREIARRALRVGPEGRGGRYTLQIPDIAAVDFPPALLPLHPYVLGAWLGDGSEGTTQIAHAQDDVAVVEHIVALGHPRSNYFIQAGTGVAYSAFGGRKGVGSAMQQTLKFLGVLRDKHVPEIYLRGSIEQRLQLMAGLIDTDGHVERKTGRIRFSTCSPALRDGVVDLATTLGFRPYVVEVAPSVSSSGITGRKPVFQIGFQATRSLPTRLPRKQILRIAPRRRIGIVSVGGVERTPARSIQVARADGLYLVGRQLVVTHNTELATKRFAAWFAGRHPEQDVIVASASDILAEDIGADVRAIMHTPQHKQVFPAFKLRRGGNAKNNVQTDQGGRLIFAGRGGTINGRGAHLLLIDDLYKDHEEARSETVRDAAWNWFTKVAMMRRMGKKLVVITMTRWHSDDIIGRLTDPENPHYNREEAESWRIIRLPGIAEDDDPLGRAPGEALWPARYDIEFHRASQRRDPLGFAALVQQRPTVADGTLFRRETIQYYDTLPEDLRFYCSSDHALSMRENRDPSCLLKVGVDRQDNIYVLDPVWKQMPTDAAVEAMLTMASGSQRPLYWWAERGHISGSIGPFLRKRMLETGVYINLIEVTPVKDKEQRAQSIAARMAMGKVLFPRGRFWVERAVNELLAFPNGTHDDFVDALAYIGLGLQSQFGPSVSHRPKDEPKPGTLSFLRQNDKWVRARELAANRGGF